MRADSLYFVVITITTVGYGDITPHTTAARLLSLLMVTLTFVLLPLQTSKLIELMNARDPFGATFRSSRRRPHILICGRVSATTLRHFQEHLCAGSSFTPPQMGCYASLDSRFLPPN